MAQIVVNIPNAVSPRIRAAFLPDVATEENPNPTNAEIAAYIRASWVAGLRDKVEKHESDEAAAAAVAGVAAPDLGAQP